LLRWDRWLSGPRMCRSTDMQHTDR
jgi:hypothetical protein